MKESRTKTFEFPDRDPKEWEWIVSLMAPMSQVSLTKSNLSAALDWFDFLCCEIGLKRCDKVMEEMLMPSGERKIEDVMDNIAVIMRYNLEFTKEICFRTIRLKLLESLNGFTNEQLDMIVAIANFVGEQYDTSGDQYSARHDGPPS